MAIKSPLKATYNKPLIFLFLVEVVGLTKCLKKAAGKVVCTLSILNIAFFLSYPPVVDKQKRTGVSPSFTITCLTTVILYIFQNDWIKLWIFYNELRWGWYEIILQERSQAKCTINLYFSVRIDFLQSKLACRRSLWWDCCSFRIGKIFNRKYPHYTQVLRNTDPKTLTLQSLTPLAPIKSLVCRPKPAPVQQCQVNGP